MLCSMCKKEFNPESLRAVVEHQHIPELVLDKDYFGKKVSEPKARIVPNGPDDFDVEEVED